VGEFATAFAVAVAAGGKVRAPRKVVAPRTSRVVDGAVLLTPSNGAEEVPACVMEALPRAAEPVQRVNRPVDPEPVIEEVEASG
jgi:hypothetical protein